MGKKIEEKQSLSEKLRNIDFGKIKKDVTLKANEGIQKITSETAKGSGKILLHTVAGFKGVLAEKAPDFVKNYISDKLAKENPTGAAAGACAEYVVKHMAKGVIRSINSLKNYLEEESIYYNRLDNIPEIEVLKELIVEYAKDDYEQGEEVFSFQRGIELKVNKEEKELSILLNQKTRKVELKYLFGKKSISELDNDFNILADDLLDRLDNLSDPAILKVDKRTVLKIPKKTGETIYEVDYKKIDNLREVNYTPKQKEGVVLKYMIQEVKENEKRQARQSKRNYGRTARSPRRYGNKKK